MSGYLQTPAGGQLETSSRKRPTLAELGVKNTFAYGAEASYVMGSSHTLVADIDIRRISSRAVLEEALVSQSHFFPAGSAVALDLKLDTYGFGYLHNLRKDAWTVSPGVSLKFLDFRYRLDSNAEGQVDRQYRKSAVRIGGRIRRDFENVSLALTGFWAIPLEDSLEMHEISARAERAITRGLMGFVEAGYLLMRYDDWGKQPDLANETDIRGLVLAAGLAYKW